LVFAAALAAAVVQGESAPGQESKGRDRPSGNPPLDLRDQGLAAPPSAVAQPPRGEPSPTGADSGPDDRSRPSGTIELQPELIYLRDKEGRLTGMLGWSLEDFLQAWQWMQRGLAAPPPEWDLTRLELEGAEIEDRAEFEVQITARVRGQGWKRIPLGLRNAVLLTPPDKVRSTGGVEQRLEIDPDGRGYVWFVRIEQKDETCQVAFRLAARIERDADGKQIALEAPRAAACQVRLGVAGRIDAVSASGDSLTLRSAPRPDGSTHVQGQGAGGAFVLSWQVADEEGAPQTIDAESRYRVTLDAQSAQVVAEVTVRSFGGSLRPFRLTAPEAWRLTSPLRLPEARLEPVAPGAGAGSEQTWLIVPETSGATLRLPLGFTLPLEAAGDDRWLRLRGLEVESAVRHTGRLGIALAGPWRATWERMESADRATAPPAEEDAAAPNWAADYQFELYAQPFLLEARLARPAVRIAVEPRYELDLDRLGAHLRARLRVAAQSGRPSNLELVNQGWIVDELGPTEAAALTSEPAEGQDVTRIAIDPGDATAVQLELRAHRPLPSPPELLSLGLPFVRADVQAPASLVVRWADNVLLNPLADPSEALVRELSAAAPPGRPQLVFRGDASRARFVAELQIQPQQVAVRSAAEIQWLADELRLEQDLSYRVDFEPLDAIRLEMPTPLWNAGSLAVTLASEPLMGVVDAQGPADGSSTRAIFRLPRAQIANFQVRIRAVVRQPLDRAAGAPAAATAPLVAPLDGRLEENTLLVRGVGAAGSSVGPGPWRPLPSAAGQEGLRLTTDERPTTVTLLEPATSAGPPDQIVERIWIQSWFMTGVRQDRVVLRLRSRGPSFSCVLPEEADPGGLTIALRTRALGQPQDLDPAALLSSDRRLTIPLPTSQAADGPYVLELRYPCPERAPGAWRRTLSPPRLSERTWVRQVYWQLLLPAHEHVVSDALGFSHEYQWGWNRLFWGRVPTIEQPQLEAWSGGEASGFAPQGANRYVYSTAGEVPVLRVATCRRSTLVLSASLLALVGAVAWRRLPEGARPAIATLGLALAAVVVLWRPDQSVLLLQAAALGLALSLVSLWIERRLGPPRLASWQGDGLWAARSSSITPHQPPALASTSSAPSVPSSAGEEEGP
jgi:hypothetical protein